MHASINGTVCRFDLKSKSDLWCFETKGKGSSLAGASYDPKANVVLYPSRTNGLYVLDPNSGELLMHWKPTTKEGEWKKTFADVAVVDDFWIVSDDDGSVRALKANYSNKLAQE